MSIEINNESEIAVDEASILRLMQRNFSALNISPEADLAIVLVDEAAMEQLHLEWMDEPGPTDVLSFPMDELRPGTDDRMAPAGMLGDIVLCPQVAQLQAEQAGHTLSDELYLLSTHGLLHLLGFDHADLAEEREMFFLQRELVEAFAEAEGREPGKTPEPRSE